MPNLIKQLSLSVFAVGIIFSTVAQADNNNTMHEKFVQIEDKLHARLGVSIFDTETGKRWAYHADDRFPMNSTFKALACAAMLARVDAKQIDLNHVIKFNKKELVTYSPVTEKQAGGNGMNLKELCDAAITMSDNTAANLVLAKIGGPAGLTAFFRSLGDKISRSDRTEPTLNTAIPGDVSDTTTPNAMVNNLHKVLISDFLSDTSRQQLTDWMVNDKVANALLRAGIPSKWKIADKTGAGGYGSRSIIAVMWPQQRQPIVAAIYITETKATLDESNAAIAEIGKTLVDVLTAPAEPFIESNGNHYLD